MEDALYMKELPDDITDVEIMTAANNINEIAIYNAIKRNKLLKKIFDDTIKLAAGDFACAIIDTKNQILLDRKYDELNRKKQEKRRAAVNKKQEALAKKQAVINAKIKEKLAKEKAQKLIFQECLTTEQKRGFKKFYGVDIDKQYGHNNY